MRISKTVEREDGSVVFQGTLEGPELDFVVEMGVNVLMKQGALPFAHTKTIKPIDFYPSDDENVQ